MSQPFLAAVENRRTYYALKAELPAGLTEQKVVELVQHAVKHVPSSFNTQTGRVAVLFGEASKKAWKSVEETYIPYLSQATGGNEQMIKDSTAKLQGYASGYGTVLFFEEQETIKSMQAKMPALAHAFPIWSEDSSGMLQFTVWTALEAEGLGCNLQHYGSYAEATTPAVLKAFDLPTDWKCTAMMPFGAIAGPPGNPAHPKTFLPIEDRVKVFSS